MRAAVQRLDPRPAPMSTLANRYGVTPLSLAAQRGRGDLIEHS